MIADNVLEAPPAPMDSWRKWDLRFLSLAKLVSSWSKDPSTKAGAVIIRPNNTLVSVGFNGFPMKMSDEPSLYANREEKYSRVVHCEVNASIFAREPLNGYTLHTYPFMCCDRCVVQMIQAGIERFVFPKASADALTRWAAAFEKVRSYMVEAGVQWDEYDAEQII